MLQAAVLRFSQTFVHDTMVMTCEVYEEITKVSKALKQLKAGADVNPNRCGKTKHPFAVSSLTSKGVD